MYNNYLNNITVSTASFFLASTATGFVANQFNLFKKGDDKTQTLSRNLFCTFGFTTCLALGIKRFSNGEIFSCSVNMIISGIFFGCLGQETTEKSNQNKRPIISAATQIDTYDWMELHDYDKTVGIFPEAAYNLEIELEKMRIWLNTGISKTLFICGNPKSGKTSLVNEFYRKIRAGIYKELQQWSLFKVKTSEFLSSKNIASEIESLATKFPNQVILFFDTQDKLLEHPVYKEFHRFNSLNIRFIFKSNTHLNSFYADDIIVKELNVEQVKDYLRKIKTPELLNRQIKLDPDAIDTIVNSAQNLIKVRKSSLCQAAIWILESTCIRLDIESETDTHSPAINLKEPNFLHVKQSDIIRTYGGENRLPESTTNQAKSQVPITLPRNPIKLYGLDGVFENLWQTLSSQGSTSKVLLVGEKKTGKNSLINNLQVLISKKKAPLLENKKIMIFEPVEFYPSDKYNKFITIFNQNVATICASANNYIVIIKNIHVLYESNRKLKPEFAFFLSLLQSPKLCMIATTNPARRDLLLDHSREYLKEIVIKPMKLEEVRLFLNDQKKALFELPYKVIMDPKTIDVALNMVPKEEAHPLLPVLDYLHRACVQALSSPIKVEGDDEKEDSTIRFDKKIETDSRTVTVLPHHVPDLKSLDLSK